MNEHDGLRLPGQRVDFRVDRSTPIAFSVMFILIWLGLLALVLVRGDAMADGLVYLAVLFGFLLVAMGLSFRRSSRTVFTTEGVWQPSLLTGGGTFLSWSDVLEVKSVDGGRGITAVDLVARSGKVRIHVTAYEDASGIVRLIRDHVTSPSVDVLPDGEG